MRRFCQTTNGSSFPTFWGSVVGLSRWKRNMRSLAPAISHALFSSKRSDCNARSSSDSNNRLELLDLSRSGGQSTETEKEDFLPCTEKQIWVRFHDNRMMPALSPSIGTQGADYFKYNFTINHHTHFIKWRDKHYPQILKYWLKSCLCRYEYKANDIIKHNFFGGEICPSTPPQQRTQESNGILFIRGDDMGLQGRGGMERIVNFQNLLLPQWYYWQ